ncbi:archaetidylserine decarboxylase [Sporosarcina sp. ACRSL]|uniref:archaetidylserine decarboxylase n=1 Tax=Sporosarcina sp. ACRSL TaxID=2918215 RepID=UPI001EF50521|nr:archaetidylserine decarboxylase [Sporosarcina sp. ACRSL]MCG7346076.1 archaetidylserine decarboxylase [Sporosarcina sp. ACRSL]
MKKILFNRFVELSGHPVSSALLKTIAKSRVSKKLIKPFAQTYHINESEAEFPIDHYSSLQAYFTRNLKKGSRPIDMRDETLISPVDGIVKEFGTIDTNQSFMIKNHLYSIKKILGDEKRTIPYKGGFFYIFYLSPSHYHHFHYPYDGELLSRYALGTMSYPVNDLGMRLGNEPFATNYRLISEISTVHGRMAIIKVGALNVNSIHILDSSNICTKGEKFGHFSFGSTVILFLENNGSFRPTVQSNEEVKMGQSVGEWVLPHNNSL